MLIGHLDALGVFLVVEAGADPEALLGLSSANEFEHGFVTIQGLGRPVARYERKHTMFDGIPLRGPGRVMTNPHLEAQSIAKTFLELVLPETITATVAAPTVAQKKNLLGPGIGLSADLEPPFADGIYGKLRGVAAGAHADKTVIAAGIINAVGNANALGPGRKVVIEDLDQSAVPSPSLLAERADQFTAFSVNAEHRKILPFIAAPLPFDIAELTVALLRIDPFARSAFNVFAILAQREVLSFEQASHSRRRDSDLQAIALLSDGVGTFATPFATTDWISGHLVFHDLFQLL